MAKAQIAGEPEVVLTLSLSEAMSLYQLTGDSTNAAFEDLFEVLDNLLGSNGFITGDEFN